MNFVGKLLTLNVIIFFIVAYLGLTWCVSYNLWYKESPAGLYLMANFVWFGLVTPGGIYGVMHALDIHSFGIRYVVGRYPQPFGNSSWAVIEYQGKYLRRNEYVLDDYTDGPMLFTTLKKARDFIKNNPEGRKD